MTDEPTAGVPVQRAHDAAAAPSRPATGLPDALPSPPAGPAPTDGTASSAAGAGPLAAAGAVSLAAAGTVVAPAATTRRRGRRWPVVVLGLALAAALAAAGYLWATTTAYAERVAWTEDQARAIGTELVTTRAELEGVRGELEAVRTQLATAQERITALASEKAQIGDDREAQAQLLDYQARVSQAAGAVASALTRCVQGQDQLIRYLEDAASYDPAELAAFTTDVEQLCRSASEANAALQSELADR